MVVATKFLPRTPEQIENGVTGQRHIARMLNRSLQNLGMADADLSIYPMGNWQTPIGDIPDGLNRMAQAGKTRYTGISNGYAWPPEDSPESPVKPQSGFKKMPMPDSSATPPRSRMA